VTLSFQDFDDVAILTAQCIIPCPGFGVHYTLDLIGLRIESVPGEISTLKHQITSLNLKESRQLTGPEPLRNLPLLVCLALTNCTRVTDLEPLGSTPDTL